VIRLKNILLESKVGHLVEQPKGNKKPLSDKDKEKLKKMKLVIKDQIDRLTKNET